MIRPIDDESKPPAKTTPFDADADRHFPPLAPSAKLKSSGHLASSCSSAALPAAVEDDKLRFTMTFREALGSKEAPSSRRSIHVVGRSASLAAEPGPANAQAGASSGERPVVPEAAEARRELCAAARSAELERIAAKLASLEKLPTDWRAEDKLAWHELRVESMRVKSECMVRSAGVPTTATRDTPSSLDAAMAPQQEHASEPLDNQIDWLAETRFALRGLFSKPEHVIRSVSTSTMATSDKWPAFDPMLAKPIKKVTVSRTGAAAKANGLWQVDTPTHFPLPCARRFLVSRVCPYSHAPRPFSPRVRGGGDSVPCTSWSSRRATRASAAS